jgi:hypothetical protein
MIYETAYSLRLPLTSILSGKLVLGRKIEVAITMKRSYLKRNLLNIGGFNYGKLVIFEFVHLD